MLLVELEEEGVGDEQEETEQEETGEGTDQVAELEDVGVVAGSVVDGTVVVAGLEVVRGGNGEDRGTVGGGGNAVANAVDEVDRGNAVELE